MKIRENLSLGIIILIMLGMISPVMNDIFTVSSDTDFSGNFQDTAEVSVYGNDDWESQSWPGNGTPEFPYRVENLSLTFIEIINSDVYFIIQNCTWSNPAYLSHAENGTIKDCVAANILTIDYCKNLLLHNLTIAESHAEESITVYFSESIWFDDCYIGGGDHGVRIESSTNCHIQNTQFTHCGMVYDVTVLATVKPSRFQGASPFVPSIEIYGGAGLWLKFCSDCFIMSNTFSENIGAGFILTATNSTLVSGNNDTNNNLEPHLTYSKDNEVTNNTLSVGLSLHTCTNCTLYLNRLGSGGLSLSGNELSSYLHKVSTNTVKEKPILYISNEIQKTYSSSEYGQIFIVNSTRITLNRIVDTAVGPSINILYSSSCTIVESTSYSISLDSSEQTTIRESIIIGGVTGISCINSPETEIINNVFQNARTGIDISQHSDNCYVFNNTLTNIANHAIRTFFNSHCIIANNTITNCAFSEYSLHWEVTIVRMSFAGIMVSGNDSFVVNNTVSNCGGYGIWVNGYRNTIYRNVLSANILGNGRSDGHENQWDDGIDSGNWWDDWTGVGVYNVPGSERCVDRYPMGRIGNETNTNTNGTLWYYSPYTLFLLSVGAGSIVIIIIALIKIVKHQSVAQ